MAFKSKKSKKKKGSSKRGPLTRIREWMMSFSYTTRITVTFALIAAMTAIVAMGVLSYVWEDHFQSYTRENIQQLAETTADNIVDRYESNNATAIAAIEAAEQAAIDAEAAAEAAAQLAADEAAEAAEAAAAEEAAAEEAAAEGEDSAQGEGEGPAEGSEGEGEGASQDASAEGEGAEGEGAEGEGASDDASSDDADAESESKPETAAEAEAVAEAAAAAALEAEEAAEEAAAAAAALEYPTLSVNDVTPAENTHELQPGMGIQVVSASGTVLYDSSRSSDSASSLAPDDVENMAVAEIVLDNGLVLGTVQMWVYGSDLLLSQADQEFRAQSYQAMALAAVLSVVLACCIGFLFARGLVNPINRITRTAAAIKEGDMSARVGLEGNDEIAEMGKTFDAMAESIEANQQLERRLTMDVAHELRTPLMAIQSTVEAIVDGVFEADEERLNTINAEVQRLSRLVDAILKLSRLENRSTPMNEETVDVGELIRPLVMSHEAFIADAGLELEFTAEEDVIVYGDPDMIRQATANLISNAVRYTPAPGKVSVRVYKGDIMASIAVQDTGIGLTPEERKMVFERFWRAEGSRQRQSGGLGVGLAVVKEIVDRHGGWVQVEGEKGEGSCFTIHIPLYDYERIKARKEKEERREKNPGKSGPIKHKGRK